MRLAVPQSLGHAGTHSFAFGIWRLADPKIALASLVPFAAGMALSERVDGGIAIAAFLAIFFVEIGKNAVNDLYDFRSGADTAVRPDERSPYSGGKRVLVDGLLTQGDLVLIAWIAFTVAAIIGTAVALRSDPRLLLLGGAAALISILYVMPPVRLAYRGLGELAVLLVYGPGIVFGTMLLFGTAIDAPSIIAALTLGILIALVLLVNEMPDERADRLAGKKTLVVRLGRERATSLAGLSFLVAFTVPTIFAAYGGEAYVVGAVAGAPIAAFAWWALRAKTDGPPVLAQTATLLTYVVSGTGLIVARLV